MNEQLKPHGDLLLSDMMQYSLKVNKVRVQLRRVDPVKCFTQYLGIEVRLIVTDCSFTKESLDFGDNNGSERKKNWWMKSLYRDAEIRALI